MHSTRRDIAMEHTGYLGNSRVVLNHYDVSTQADIQHVALSYESEDEMMGRGGSRGSRRSGNTAHYSKQDIREQYCISDRGMEALESDRQSLFGCLSSHQNSPCTTKGTSLLTACVRQKAPSDENLYELYRRHPAEYAPYPRRCRYPWAPLTPEIYRYDEDLKTSYFRRKAHIPEPSRYTWMPSDDESVRMEKPRSVMDGDERVRAVVHPAVSPPPPAPPGKKHVSFARSHTMASFDDAMASLGHSSSHVNRMTRSQERLLDVRKADGMGASGMPITRQPELSDNLLIIDKVKRPPMKTQATQTEACLGRKPLPPGNINLSPRTIHRVKMVSQGAQTNGFLVSNGRKLIKSFSEAGSKFCRYEFPQPSFETITDMHEPLQRTQSDEPPRSPFVTTSPPPPLPMLLEPPPSDSSSLSRSDERESEDSESKREIFIDFKPQMAGEGGATAKMVKRPLTKAVSDGEILLDHRKSEEALPGGGVLVPEKPSLLLTSFSHENITASPETQQVRSFKPYFQKSPIRHEGICSKPLIDENVYSSLSFDDSSVNFHAQDSIDEEFHENLIYNRMLMEESGYSPGDECVVPSVCLMTDRGKMSPFASNDSLANDVRDHSDGIWNESQATVLQVDSGTDNGTALSSSEMTSVTSPGSAILLTPSSRRKHLLMMQHQQRSSMDTEALDEEFAEQSEMSPRIVIEKAGKTYAGEHGHKQQYLTPQRTISPTTWRSRRAPATPEPSPQPPSAESPLPAVVPDLLLARTDSAKTNTDVSESTTTDDYITANSGTDSSRKSGGGMDMYNLHAHMHDGSSFESTKGSDVFADGDMVVPSFSPPMSHHHSHHHSHMLSTSASSSTIAASATAEEARSLSNTPVPDVRTASVAATSSVAAASTTPTRHHREHHHHHHHHREHGRSSPSDTSSSCGSYSVDGSCPDLLGRASSKVPSSSTTTAGSSASKRGVDEDERSSSIFADKTNWKETKRRPFTLDITKQPHQETYALSPPSTKAIAKSKTPSPATETLKVEQPQKPKRSKPRTRSPMQAHKKHYQVKKTYLPLEDRYKILQLEDAKVTSDDSSCDLGRTCQTSPRKSKKNKENNRRKSLPRSSPTRPQKRFVEPQQPASLPGSLSRRRSSKSKGLQAEDAKSTLALYSPVGSPKPGKKKHSPQRSPETTAKLKALSAESLRSVSPGSDSVFYSDPSSHTAVDHQVHCLHCGKEMEIVTADDPDKSLSSNNGHHQHDIVQPPAGFEDSPRTKHAPTGRLYKKSDRRFRSEDRGQPQSTGEYRRHRFKPDVRAKSEERGAKAFRGKLRPMARSTNNSQEVLKATDSSPSVLPGAPEDEDDQGIYDVPYNEACWIYIDERDEVYQSYSSPDQTPVRRDSTSSTESEREFRKRYQSVTHRMVHRKSCLEMYKKQTSNSFDNGSSASEEPYMREQLEEILKLMLMIWCRENQALKIVSTVKSECDKTVIVRRGSGEFGFRIHGSKPVVVSAIEPGTPAETSGLEVGDIVISVNGVSVLDKSHSEVVKIAHAGSDTLALEVSRTCYALNTSQDDHSAALYSGYLWKLSGYASGTTSNKWIRRWFCLKQNNCLYYYKTDSEKQPVGVVMLFEHEIKRQTDDEGGYNRPLRFVLYKPESVPLHLAADNPNALSRWLEVISNAIADTQTVDEFLEETKRNLASAACAIPDPDCFGYLVKLGTQWKAWSRRYCVLKDACLYFYQDANSKSAFGVAYLHGYKVQQPASGSKKHSFEIIPPDDPNKKHFYFHTESDADRKRWTAALEYSIDRWLKVQ